MTMCAAAGTSLSEGLGKKGNGEEEYAYDESYDDDYVPREDFTDPGKQAVGIYMPPDDQLAEVEQEVRAHRLVARSRPARSGAMRAGLTLRMAVVAGPRGPVRRGTPPGRGTPAPPDGEALS